MRYWWVNQNETYRTEVRGNFLWSPKTKANGARNSPLLPSGNGSQSVYLTEVPELMAQALIAVIGHQAYFEALSVLTGFPSTPDAEDDSAADVADLPPTFRDQVIKARRGQGIFRANVMLIEEGCRVTHVTDRKHLRASHIKPWREASDTERLSGENGLLLSPHIDHLFDKGYISFSSSEQLLVVPEVRPGLLDRWGIGAGTSVGSFSRQQKAFLDYHRSNVAPRATGVY